MNSMTLSVKIRSPDKKLSGFSLHGSVFSSFLNMDVMYLHELCCEVW